MNSEDHKPPRFIVRNPNPVTEDGEFETFDDNAGLGARAQELARANPGEFIDIYQHATAIRSPVEQEAAHADEG